VLDLGSGGGKICYIAAQVVGPAGQVTGVDMNDDMLALARQFQGEVTENIGWDNVSFRKGRIQDLKLDLDQLEEYLQTSPANNANSWVAAEQQANTLRNTAPMIANECVDVVVSNCVLNLVKNEDRLQLFNELFRVLKPGGRAVISDIVSNGPVPQHLQDDATLWSGCISGAFEEHAFANAFTNAGFVSVEILVRQSEPWQTVEGIEFRSVTIRAWKHYKSQTPDVINLSDDSCCDPNSNCC
jgi:ubiquinone/menaquinone biosynthesis C-methylase UbiE